MKASSCRVASTLVDHGSSGHIGHTVRNALNPFNGRSADAQSRGTPWGDGSKLRGARLRPGQYFGRRRRKEPPLLPQRLRPGDMGRKSRIRFQGTGDVPGEPTLPIGTTQLPPTSQRPFLRTYLTQLTLPAFGVLNCTSATASVSDKLRIRTPVARILVKETPIRCSQTERASGNVCAVT